MLWLQRFILFITHFKFKHLRNKEIDYLVYPKQELDELLKKSKQGSYYEFGELSQYVREIANAYFLTKYYQKQITKKEDVEELTNSVFLLFAEQYHDIINIGYWMRRVLFISFVRWYKKYKIKSLYSKTKSYNNRDESNKAFVSNLLMVLNTFGEEKQKIVNLKLWANLTFKQIAENIRKSETEVVKIFHSTIISVKNRLR